jgi:arylsulfatase A-like enzyme
MMPRPNILFFFTDDQRFDTIRALGNDQIHTPNLDALVARGTAFTHAHIPGGSSGAVCMPSRAMLHTGRTLYHIQGEGQSIAPDHTTLGECLQAAGYDCFGTGKWHNERDAFARSFSCGDEIFYGGMGDHWNVPAYRYDPSGRYEMKLPYVENPWQSNELTYREGDHIHAGVHSTDLFVDATIQHLESRQGDGPLFMYVALMAPHDPRTMPQKYLDMYDPDTIELPKNFLGGHPIDTGALRVRDETLAAFPRNPAEIRRHIAEYYGMITHLDDALGRLIAALEARGELENTIVVVAGDNGLALGQHGLMGKQNLYDHSVRVPLIFAGPGIEPGVKRDDLVYLLDIFPTLCELTGTEIPDSVEGRSLLPALCGDQKVGRDSLYLAYVDTIRGLSDGRHKLIEYACGETQLFDLEADPLEMSNLAQSPEAADRVAAMRKQLVAEAAQWEDTHHPQGKTFWSKRPDLRTN